MTFTIQDNVDKHFAVVKQHVLNTAGNTREYRIADTSKITPYHFTCPVCHDSTTNIDCSDTKWVESMKVQIDWQATTTLSCIGDMGKVIICDHCDTPYFIGIGYTEPNYGRDVFLLHCIIELQAVADRSIKDDD